MVEELLELLEDELVFDSFVVVESDDFDVLDPMVVGSDNEVAVAVSAAETLVRSTAFFPEAEAATLVPMSEAEPQPY